jgi:outer membrane protein
MLKKNVCLQPFKDPRGIEASGMKIGVEGLKQNMKEMTNNIYLKRFSLALFALLSWQSSLFAQKFSYVDTEYILQQIPEYRSAQKQIDELAETWQKQIDAQYAAIDKLYKDYKAEEILLNGEQKKQRESEIIAKEKEVKKLQQDKFGYEGELFKKRQELIKPIQDRVFEAIQKVAKENALDFIFDKSGDMVMLFSNARYDKSDEVLEELGITPIKDKKTGDGPNVPPGGDNLPPRD